MPKAESETLKPMHTWAFALVALASLALVALLQVQLLRLRAQSTDAGFVLPMARTVADVLSTTPLPSLPAMMARLEDTRFRTITVVVYSRDGEVFLDTSSPTSGKLPMPPSARQKQAFDALMEAKVGEHPEGVAVTLMRSCNPRGGEATANTIAAVPITGLPGVYAVSVCACGDENV